MNYPSSHNSTMGISGPILGPRHSPDVSPGALAPARCSADNGPVKSRSRGAGSLLDRDVGAGTGLSEQASAADAPQRVLRR